MPITGDPDTFNQTNEIGTAIPLLEPLNFKDKDITAGALLTQRSIAQFVRSRLAHYHFTVKGNYPALLADLERYFAERPATAHFTEISCGHGRTKTRSVWTNCHLNDYLDFPDLAEAFLIERRVIEEKSGSTSRELAYGITSRPGSEVSPQGLLEINHGHWVIENCCHYVIDWNFDDDRSRIRCGHGPENVSRLRRSPPLIDSKPGRKIAETLRRLNRNVRIVFEYLLMSENSRRIPPRAPPRPIGLPPPSPSGSPHPASLRSLR